MDAKSAAPSRAEGLDRLTLVIGAIIALFGLVLLAIVLFVGLTANRSATESERQLIANAFDESVARVLNEQRSVAWWDDSVRYATRDFDPNWFDENIGLFLNETYGHDELYVLDENNRFVYRYADGVGSATPDDILDSPSFRAIVAEARLGEAEGLTPRSDAFKPDENGYSVLSGVLDSARWAGHLLTVDGQPAIVAAITISPNLEVSVLTGEPYLLISVAYIDQPFLEKIGHSLLLDDLALRSTPSPDSKQASELFLGDSGAEFGYLTWTTRRPGNMLLTVVLPLIAVSIAASGLLFSSMFGRLRRAYTELSQREVLAQYQAKHDALSRLPNRQFFGEVLAERLADRQKVAVAYVDIDRFKDLNDTLGHHVGDGLIQAVGQRLRAHLDKSDLIARFGGDEFAIMRRVDANLSAGLSDSLARAFSTSFTVHGHAIHVTASAGIVVSPVHGHTADELMRNADIALYEAKKGGRNQAVFFNAGMAAQVETRRTIELALFDALRNGGLELAYQPVIAADTGGIHGVEALLRWMHPQLGRLSPAVFIPIAEESGLMPQLGEWVLKRAFSDAARWPQIEVSVNLSPAQFKSGDLNDFLKSLIADTGVNPRRIVLEITEGVLLDSTPRTMTILRAIRDLGFLIALDDFGTGYSSLRYLTDFTFDKVKIDRSFVSKMHQDAKARTIVQSVVALGRSLGLEVVAEGIETEADAAVMRLFGCTEMQGFLFSVPVTPGAIEAMLEAPASPALRLGSM